MSLSPVSYPAPSPTAVTTQPFVAPQPALAAQLAEKVQIPAPIAPTKAISEISRVEQDAKLEKAVDVINRFLKPVASSLQFSIDEESGRTLVKVIDTDTNDVLRQFPSKEALAISNELDKLQGLLVRDKA